MDARRLHVLRMVAVSQQLAMLEREAGTTLVHRSSRGVTLTTAGQRPAMRAERIEHELLAARRDLAELIVEHDHDRRRPRRAGLTHVRLMVDRYRVVVPAGWHPEPASPADPGGLGAGPRVAGWRRG